LKDKFVQTSVPRWADEGTAILSDTDAKQSRHLADLKRGLASGHTFSAVSLLTLADYPRPEEFGLFYGQSASLTEYLVERKDPATFITFIENAEAVGYDAALRACYNIKNVGELDRNWRHDAASAITR